MHRISLVVELALLALAAPVACTCAGPAGLLGAPVAAIQPAIEFGPRVVGTTTSDAIVIANQGGSTLHIVSLTVEGPGFSTTRSGPIEIAPSTSDQIDVTFAPDHAGAFVGVMRIASDASNAPSFAVALRGEGSAAGCPADDACRTWRFDGTSGTCVATDVDGPCDDGSVCTTEDRCEAGVCIGDPIACADVGACGRASCDAVSGCGFVADDTRCDDGEACTDDVCARDARCLHAPRAEGARCGAFGPCVDGACTAGVCTTTTRVDLTPCDDGLLCTVDEVCVQGRCLGARSDGPARVSSTASTFGAEEPFVLVPGATDDACFVGRQLQRAHRDGASFDVVARANVDDALRDAGHVIASSAGLLSVTTRIDRAGGARTTLHTWTLDGAQAVLAGSVELVDEPGPVVALAASGTRAFIAGTALHAVDVASFASPVATSRLALDLPVTSMVATGTRLFIGHESGILLVDTAAGALSRATIDGSAADTAPVLDLAVADVGVLALRGRPAAGGADAAGAREIGVRVDILQAFSGALVDALDVAGRGVSRIAAHGARAVWLGRDLELVALPGGALIDRASLSPLAPPPAVGASARAQVAMSSSLVLAQLAFGGAGTAAFAWGIDADRLVEATAPDHGPFGLPVPGSDGVGFAAGATSLRVLSLADGAPRLVAGGLTRAGASLLEGAGVALDAVMPVDVDGVSPRTGALALFTARQDGTLALQQARTLDAPDADRLFFVDDGVLVALSLRPPGVRCGASAADALDGSGDAPTADLCSDDNAHVVLEAFDLQARAPFPLARLGVAAIPLPGAIRLHGSTWTSDAPHLAIAIETLDGTVVVVGDADDPLAPRIVPPVAVAHVPSSLLLARARLYLADVDGLAIRAVQADSLVPLSSTPWADLSLDAAAATHLLAADPQVLVAGNGTTLAWLDVEALPPRLVTTTALPMLPHFARANGDALVVQGVRDAVLVTPVCPAP